MAVVGEAIQQRSGHLGVPKHAGPFREVQIGGDHHAGPLVQPGQQMEEQCLLNHNQN